MNPIRAARKREKPKISVTIPYVRGTSEKIKSIFKRFGAEVFYRKHNTIGRTLCKNSPVYEKEEQKDLIYEVPCEDCPQSLHWND